MTTTIDKAGRVVIPAPNREAARLTPGTRLEVILGDFSVRLVRAVKGPEVTHRGNRLIARPRAPKDQLPSVALGALVEEERNRWPQ